MAPAWPHYRWARITTKQYLEQPLGISDFGFTDGTFRQRLEGGEATISPGLEGLEGLLFYAAYRPELFKLLVEHTWNTHCKGGETPDSRVVWEILKLKEKHR